METVAGVGRKPLRVMGLRKSKQEREGTVGMPSHQAVDGGKGAAGGYGGRTKAGLRPPARQERRQKHRTEQEPGCFHGTKINIFSGCVRGRNAEDILLNNSTKNPHAECAEHTETFSAYPINNQQLNALHINTKRHPIG